MSLSLSDTTWLAGIFEGEGCICIFSQKGVRPLSVRLSVEMMDQDVVERFYSLVQVGNLTKRKKKQRPHWADKYIWQAGAKKDTAYVLDLLYPHLGERRK